MIYSYEIICAVDMEKTIDSVGTLVKELNAAFKQWGLEEELSIQSKMQIGILTCNRKLTVKEIADMKRIISEEFDKAPVFQRYGIRVDSICESTKPYKATNATNAQN